MLQFLIFLCILCDMDLIYCLSYIRQPYPFFSLGCPFDFVAIDLIHKLCVLKIASFQKKCIQNIENNSLINNKQDRVPIATYAGIWYLLKLSKS